MFCHFSPFFALLPHCWTQKLKLGKNVKNIWRYYPFTHVYHKSRSYDVWFLRYKEQRTEFFCHFGPIWSPFYPPPPLNLENQNFEKMKKTRCIITLNMSTINENCMMYDSWDMEHNRIFLILDHFLSFYTPSP